MNTMTIKSTGYKYGHPRGSDTASIIFYMGKVWNGSNTSYYDSSIKFVPTETPWGNLPIAISKITLITAKRNYSAGGTDYDPYAKNLGIYLSLQDVPCWGSYEYSLGRSIGTFNSSQSVITDPDALAIIAGYLMNKVTFYLHVYGEDTGGLVHGYSLANGPSISIEWDYANSTGTLNKTNFNCGESATITLNVRGTNYKHTIDCYINGNKKSSIDTISYSSQVVELTNVLSFNPSADQIDNWFPTNTSFVSGYFDIITKNSSGSQIGQNYKLYFTLNLTSKYCNDTGYLILNSLSFKNQSSKNPLITGKTYIVVSEQCSKPSSLSTTMTLTLTDGFLGTVSTTSTTNEISLKTIIGASALKANLTLKDSRGLTYTISGNSEIPVTYTNPILSGINFYRSDGSKKVLLGKKIGCSFTVQAAAISGNSIQDIYIQYSNTSTSTISPNSNKYTYASTNLFPNLEFELNTSYVLNIYIKDNITSDESLDGYQSGYYIYSVTVPKAEYIIHIPQGGRGIAFGTAYSYDSEDTPYVEFGWQPKFNQALAVESGGTGVESEAELEEKINKLIKIKSPITITNAGKDLNILGWDTDDIQLGNDSIDISILGKKLQHNGNNIAVLGENIICAAEGIKDGTGTGFPEGYDKDNTPTGMIWLKII